MVSFMFGGFRTTKKGYLLVGTRNQWSSVRTLAAAVPPAATLTTSPQIFVRPAKLPLFPSSKTGEGAAGAAHLATLR